MLGRGAKVLVTGGAGFIGSHVCEVLLQAGFHVRIIDDLSAGYADNLKAIGADVEMFDDSILSEETLNKSSVGVVGIFHCAAVTGLDAFRASPDLVHEVNTLGMLRVLECARRNGSKVIFSSASTVYGGSRQLPIRESSGASPLTPYGVQKLACEQYLRCYNSLYGLEGRSLRYFNVYGPRQRPQNSYSSVVGSFVRKAVANERIELFGDGESTRDFIYVKDVAEANLRAFQSDSPDVDAVNVGTGQSTSIRHLARQIVQHCGSKSEIVEADYRPNDLRHSLADCTLALDRIGFISKISLDQGLRETIDYFSKYQKS